MAKDNMQEKLYNLQAQQLASQVANWAAQLDFQKERFRLLEMPQFQQGLQLEVDKFAWEKAQDTWERAYQEAAITGMYQGQPTTQWLMDQAKMTGTFNGERTLEGKLTDAQIQDMQDKMKLANDQFLAATTGYFNGQKTFDREKFEGAQALEGWKFISTLTGPQNAFKQARAIATMPGGMDQMMQAFAGQYMLPSSANVGSGGAGGADPAGQLQDMMHGTMAITPYTPPGPAAPAEPGAPALTPGVLVTPAPTPAPGTVPPFSGVPGAGLDPSYWTEEIRAAVSAWNVGHPGYYANGSAAGYASAPGTTPSTIPISTPAPGAVGAPPTPTAAPAMAQGMTYTPPGAQAPQAAYNYSATQDGSVSVYPPGVVSPAATADVSTQTPQNPAAVSGIVNQPYQYGGAVIAPQTTGNGMLNPNQISGENYDNAFQYQKDLLWANYEDQGYDKSLAQEAFVRSLPKYSGVTKGAVAF